MVKDVKIYILILFLIIVVRFIDMYGELKKMTERGSSFNFCVLHGRISLTIKSNIESSSKISNA